MHEDDIAIEGERAQAFRLGPGAMAVTGIESDEARLVVGVLDWAHGTQLKIHFGCCMLAYKSGRCFFIRCLPLSSQGKAYGSSPTRE